MWTEFYERITRTRTTPGSVKSVMRRISPSEQIMIVTRCYSSNRNDKVEPPNTPQQ